MRYRLMATYRGVPYEAGIGPTDEDVVLFAACPPPEELGFEPATGHWRKQLRIKDVQALWESRPVGTFRGDRCVVLDDLGDRLHIAYQGHDAFRAEQLGYWEVDRGVFELVAPRDEVSEIVEERLDYPHRRADVPTAPEAAEPAAPVPPARGPGTTAPHRTGPLPVVPHLTGPHAAVPNARAPQRTGPPPAAANSNPPHMTGPLPAVPNSTGPHMTGPLPAVPNSTGPELAGPVGAASNATGPQMTGPYMTGPLPAVPGPADSSPDLAVIPPSSEPPLPLEAAARRAATARVLLPDPVPEPAYEPQPAPQPQAAPQPQPAPQAATPAPTPQAPPLSQSAPPSQPAPQAAPQRRPASQPPAVPQAGRRKAGRPEPAALEPDDDRERRAALRRQATQRIFAELAGLAAIPPSAYAVGEEVDGAMCLVQTPDGFEVFNASAGARHEVRIFDDEESAYFYLFGVLAAEAVRTGRLAPQG
jgi:hypothetical protein